MLSLAVLLSFHVCQGVMNLVLFSQDVVNSTGARCLDGTPSGYYFEPASAAENVTKWVFFLEGGGACWDYDSCKQRSTSALGSSNYWAPTHSDPSNVLSHNVSENPAWATWNHVYIPYCGGDVHSGQRKDKAWNELYFAGYFSVTTVFDQLSQLQSLKKATQVLISGGSAGGIGTFVHANQLFDYLPNATVKAEPQGGWFFPNVTYYANWKNGTFFQLPDPAIGQLWNQYLEPACVKDHPDTPSLCGTIDVAYNYMRCPIFVSENKFDTNQIFTQLGCPQNASDTNDYIAYFGKGMRASIQKLIDSPKKDGLFFMNCLNHTANTGLNSNTVVKDYKQKNSIIEWFFGGNTYPHQLVDDCAGDLPCNPTCNDGHGLYED